MLTDMKILTSRQMAEVDRLTTEVYRLPSLILMENAGRAVAEELEKACPGLKAKRIMIFCGKGNNGGDGFVVARHLAIRGFAPEVLLFADQAGLRGDALSNWDVIRAMDLPVTILPTSQEAIRFLRRATTTDVIVDALFGTGLSKPIGPDFRAVVEWINQAASHSFVVSVDIPSGLFADSASVPGPAVKAHLTVTFTALKLALIVPPASNFAGKVVIAPIGSPTALLDNPEYRVNLIDAAQVRRALPSRPRDSHKGTFGQLIVVAGSPGKSGAALMTGLAALRSGAGLVTLWLPKSLQRAVVGKVPELMTESLPETEKGTADCQGLDVLIEAASGIDAMVIGPGMTTHPSTQQLVRELVRRSPVPAVLDADGINAFAGRRGQMRNDAGRSLIITPHPGEMARLLDRPISSVQKNRPETARLCAEENSCFVILKGFQSVVAAPNGQVFINNTGNPGMATGGSGDILAGMVGRFVAGWNRRFHGADAMALVDHLCAAVYLHGLAGDLAADEKGAESMIATDLVPYLPAAFRSVVCA